jgi:hypothetical protein
LIIALSVAKAGYYGGNLQTIMKAPLDLVLAAYEYEIFLKDYEAHYIELNKNRDNQ